MSMPTPFSLFDRLAAPPVFVVGAARSGTTWVYDILTAHPEVAGAYETWLFTPANGLGALFTDAHWPAKHSGLGKLLPREKVLVVAREAAERVLSEAVCEGRRFLVEKSPNHLYAIPLIEEVLPGCRFIHVLRDGRDVGVSVRAATRSWVPAWRETFGKSIRASARFWCNAVDVARRHGALVGERFLEVRYEDLRGDPETSVRRLFAFAGIPLDEERLERILEKTDFDRNFKPDPDGFRRKGQVGDWLTELGLRDRYAFHRIAFGTLEKLGYESDRLWWLRPGRRRRSGG